MSANRAPFPGPSGTTELLLDSLFIYSQSYNSPRDTLRGQKREDSHCQTTLGVLWPDQHCLMNHEYFVTCNILDNNTIILHISFKEAVKALVY